MISFIFYLAIFYLAYRLVLFRKRKTRELKRKYREKSKSRQ